MENMRKFYLLILMLVLFAGIMIMSKFAMDPVDLGLAIALVAAGPMGANAAEHLAKRGA